jgi:Putative lumazine-binding
MSAPVGTDVDQVVAVATDYLTSFYSGSAKERAARMRRVLHPHLAKRSPSHLREDGTFYEWELPEMLDIAAGSVDEGPKRPYSVRLLDVAGDMASVRTDADWGVDYLHLARIGGEWKVVNVLWD